MHWTQSALLLVMVMLGGAGRRWGAPLGVALWLTLEEVPAGTDYWHWPLGLLLLLVVFHAPQGGRAARAPRRPGGRAMSLFRAEGLVKRFGGLLATDHVDLAVEAGRSMR